jgi:hypothetical protein
MRFLPTMQEHILHPMQVMEFISAASSIILCLIPSYPADLDAMLYHRIQTVIFAIDASPATESALLSQALRRSSQ